jgi:hypothetical protein
MDQHGGPDRMRGLALHQGDGTPAQLVVDESGQARLASIPRLSLALHPHSIISSVDP